MSQNGGQQLPEPSIFIDSLCQNLGLSPLQNLELQGVAVVSLLSLNHSLSSPFSDWPKSREALDVFALDVTKDPILGRNYSLSVQHLMTELQHAHREFIGYSSSGMTMPLIPTRIPHELSNMNISCLSNPSPSFALNKERVESLALETPSAPLTELCYHFF
ncbi:hypothetical protein GYMLUDRAFT_59663 [Collybiopsis luxurians FD-317 M1]|uniref:Uncharacterized protein n=1 Tax=Collybiopsis luxurians FD-317 M1 TaxID=944289 RepID=A0A0D0CVV1_9AGAR|nr:hypothetical protein GYMLUDRAFT_59663 [Collybiopsis luxurians FD-317 M1]